MMTAHITNSAKVLHVLAEGEFTLDEAKRTFMKVIDAVVNNESEKVLFDGTAITGEPSIIERFYYGEFAAAAVQRSTVKGESSDGPMFAYILLPPVLDPERLGETVAANRGMNVKAFDDLDAGLEWLGLAPDDL